MSATNTTINTTPSNQKGEVITMKNITNSICPRIVKETSAGLNLYDIQDDMLQHRVLECTGTIDTDSVYSLCRQLRYLQQEDPNGEITIFINSPGGEVSSGLALYDVMKGISCPIRTVCLGEAASMAAVLFAAGDKREILPHGRIMIHDPLIPSTGGSALHLAEISRNLMATRQELCDILARHTGKTLEEIYEKTVQDCWFNADEAVAFGLADRVIHTI